ncbi:MAG: hypothetical protein O2954_02890 [bacterium]|nr:hypothetical protein [bacterium]
MKIATCRSYHGITSSVNLLHMPDGKSAFKIYYLSIIGRDKPELYEWEHCAPSTEQFEETFRASSHEGIGFITAFPHITKVFRFSPVMETVMDITEMNTNDLEVRDCPRDDEYHEFACYAEAVIAAEEYHAWAKATSVDEYLKFRCTIEDFPVASNTKLATHWTA